jgi:hypothetical protein
VNSLGRFGRPRSWTAISAVTMIALSIPIAMLASVALPSIPGMGSAWFVATSALVVFSAALVLSWLSSAEREQRAPVRIGPRPLTVRERELDRKRETPC